MTFEYPTDDDPISDEWWVPLLAAEARMGESSRLLDRCLRVEDFMLMGRIRRRGRTLGTPALPARPRRKTARHSATRAPTGRRPRRRPRRGMTSLNRVGKEEDVSHRGP